MRALQRDRTDIALSLRMGGLVTGSRIRPYVEMAGYIRSASSRMAAVTGMAIGGAFYDRILTNPTILASSLVACDAVLQVRQRHPDRTRDFAHTIQIAHFQDGEDLNDPAVHQRSAEGLGLDMTFELRGPRDLSPGLAAEFRSTREIGINSYPSVLSDATGHWQALPTVYDPAAFLDKVRS